MYVWQQHVPYVRSPFLYVRMTNQVGIFSLVTFDAGVK
jgi:hypothetical protein